MKYTTEKAAAAFTEWFRRYVENPHEFEAEFNTVANFRDGGCLDYGHAQAAYFEKIMGEFK